ncbi:MAG: glycoside hydrolase family 92 protein, partial [Crocinitomicaceae bacterium]|nr:glycoside hydrolase family 92 protein [Crocinitomicaceae bacterium]
SSEIDIIDKQTLQGKRISESWATNQHFYFYLSLSEPYLNAKKITKKGKNKLLLEFPKETSLVKLKIGISAVDEQGAKQNLESEIPHWNINTVRANTVKDWNKELNKIKIESLNKEQLTIFYTALYHSFLAPNIFSDVDYRYRGRDNKIHVIENKNDKNYTVFSLWDTYRATHPLFTIVQQEKTNEFIKTFLRQYEQGGDLPVWELAGNETECMIGYHSVSVIADAYTKGIRDYDSIDLLGAMMATSKFDEYGKKSFRNGFISSDEESESVSKTLEYAYDDFCIAQMAKSIFEKNYKNRTCGNEIGIVLNNWHKEYTKSSYHFCNLFDPKSKFMRARRGAQWHSPFDPAEVNFNYTEANSWQYSLYAPHAVNTLCEMIGGKEEFENWLDSLFTTTQKVSGRQQADITGLIGQYAHGNEPSHHMAYLYNYTNSPYKSQYYVDKILTDLYHNKPDGLSGNEDCGQMSSWYVLSSLGIYQIAPGNPVYEIGRPLFDKASVHLENGKTFGFITKNNHKDHPYIQSVFLNGKALTHLQIKHQDIINGGELVIKMGKEPNKSFKPSIQEELPMDFSPIPFIRTEDRVFEDSLRIEMGVLKMQKNKSCDIEYSINNKEFKVYKRPFTIKQTSNIKIRSVQNTGKGFKKYGNDSLLIGQTVESDFIKRDKSITLELQSEYSSQYTASGKDALIDKIKGGNDFRTGDWQGYYGKDIKGIITFEDPKAIEKINFSFFVDQRSWIFSPKELNIEISYNGIDFHPQKSIDIKNSLKRNDKQEKISFYVPFPKSKEAVKKIRFTIKNPGLCPKWHLGAGNKSWVFIDEISFE